MSLAMQANKTKIGVLLAYLCSQIPDMKLRKLIKLVFLVDEASVNERGYPITWLDYYVWKKGPVALEIFNIKEKGGEFSDYIAVFKSEDDKYTVHPQKKIDIENGLAKFSDNQLKLINNIIEKCKNLSADELSEITHENESLWHSAVQKNNLKFNAIDSKTDIKLDFISLLEKNSDKYYSYIEAFENMQFKAALNTK